MATICPKCSADTEPLEEETEQFCIHETLLLLGGTGLIIAGIAVYAGLL